MSVTTFDTLKYSNTLKAAGVPERQAEAEALALYDILSVNIRELVAKDDLKIELGLLKTELKNEIGQVKTELKNEIGQLRAELKNESRELELKMGAKIDLVDSHARGEFFLMKWMLATTLGIVISIAIRLFFFPHPPV